MARAAAPVAATRAAARGWPAPEWQFEIVPARSPGAPVRPGIPRTRPHVPAVPAGAGRSSTARFVPPTDALSFGFPDPFPYGLQRPKKVYLYGPFLSSGGCGD